jgi:hypothetical protein
VAGGHAPGRCKVGIKKTLQETSRFLDRREIGDLLDSCSVLHGKVSSERKSGRILNEFDKQAELWHEVAIEGCKSNWVDRHMSSPLTRNGMDVFFTGGIVALTTRS